MIRSTRVQKAERLRAAQQLLADEIGMAGALLIAETVNLAVSASKDGKLRVVYACWDDPKVVLNGPSARTACPCSYRQRHSSPP